MKRIKYNKVRKLQSNFFEYTGDYTDEPTAMQLFVYDEHGCKEFKNVALDKVITECKDTLQTNNVKWLNIHGLNDTQLIQKIADLFKLESFIVGDILNTSRRTRIEEMDDVLFFSVKSILPEEDDGIIKTEQISFLLKDNFIVSFQEKRSDYFTHIRERIRTGGGVVRKKKNDYLLYLMLDAIMENFFMTIERFEIQVEALHDGRMNYKGDFITGIQESRDNLNFIKRSITPLREALYNLKSEKEEDEYETISKSSHLYFARLHQKCLEMLDQVDYGLSSLDSASNFYFSAQSQRMNQIMKTLTIFSVIFMPLTFIVGVYGMNFDNMPELHEKDGYYWALGIMVFIAICMTIYFKKKDWF